MTTEFNISFLGKPSYRELFFFATMSPHKVLGTYDTKAYKQEVGFLLSSVVHVMLYFFAFKEMYIFTHLLSCCQLHHGSCSEKVENV